MKIQASLIAYEDSLPSGVEPAFWTVEGSEAQVYWKLKRNVLGLIAMKNVEAQDENMLSTELKRLSQKYNLGECPTE